MSISRRRFVHSVAAAGLTLGLPGLRRARAHAWGAMGESVRGARVPVGGYKVLEVFLYGGLSPWETVYVRPQGPDPFFGLRHEVAALEWNTCAELGASTETRHFGTDAEGEVAWGPATSPLWRADIFSRVRLVVMRHNLEPHEAAIPLALTGHALGRVNFSGLGSAISHRFAGASGGLPCSYCLLPARAGALTDNFHGIYATGTHGGQHRPLTLKIGASGLGRFTEQLDRERASPETDALLHWYRAAYADRLRWKSEITRARGFEAYNAALNNAFNAPALKALLKGAPLASLAVSTCQHLPSLPREATTRSAIFAAAHLLSQKRGGARYVGVVDAGVIPSNGSGYDTHEHNTRNTAVNLWATCRALADVIDPNADASTPPASGKISLFDTMVVLKTEFGRTPQPSPATGPQGRDHWPHGYACALIGGPVATRGIAGSIAAGGSYRGQARQGHHFNPSELQAALMLAADVFPFEQENFGVGSMSGLTQDQTEEATAIAIREKVLGA